MCRAAPLQSLLQLLLALFFLCDRADALVTPRLVKDINNLPSSAASSDPSDFVVIGNQAFFAATAPGSGRELWISDGTDEGTRLVRNLFNGEASASPTALTRFGDILLFQAKADTALEGALWRSDGSEAGTVLVSEVVPTSDILDVGGLALYLVDDQLWRTDGTPSGTFPVFDTPPAVSFLSILGSFDGILFLVGRDTTHGGELWRSDGTPQGTALVREITPNRLSTAFSAGTSWNGAFYFIANPYAVGPSLWRTQGEDASTERIATLDYRALSFASLAPAPAGDLLFIVTEDIMDRIVWRTDGTESGTKELTRAPLSRGTPKPFSYGTTSDSILFPSDSNGLGTELWTSDGTAEATRLLSDLVTGPKSSDPRGFTSFDDAVYFTASAEPICRSSSAPALGKLGIFPPTSEGEPSVELCRSTDVLWRTEGTAQSTRPIASFSFISNGEGADPLAVVGDRLLFAAGRGDIGSELWSSDGTTEGTVLLREIWEGSGSSNPYSFVDAAGTLYFIADDGVVGPALWRSDGSASGTFAVFVAPAGARISSLVRAIDTELLWNVRPANGAANELWGTDGTISGTRRFKTLELGSASPRLDSAVAFNGNLLLPVSDSEHGTELWRSDRTELGTALLKDVLPSTASSTPRALTVFGAHVYFIGNTATDSSLYRTDGTADGTELVFPGIGRPNDTIQIVASSDMLFLANRVNQSTQARGEIWRSDGSMAGTTKIGQYYSPTLQAGAVANTALLVAATRPEERRRLWLIGPGSSTEQLFPNTTSADSAFYGPLMSAGSETFFVAGSAQSTTLWKTDGTAAGTLPVQALPIDGRSVNSSSYRAGNLYILLGATFFPIPPSRPAEIWKSDGSAAGTYLISQIPTGGIFGPAPGQQAFPTFSGSHLFHAQYTGAFGRELWAVDLEDISRPCGGDCDGDATVGLGEIITMTELALRGSSATSCRSGDSDGNNAISVDELVAAVANVAVGCAAGSE